MDTPKKTLTSHSIRISRVSNVGTSNPVVARVVLQSLDLFKFSKSYSLENEKDALDKLQSIKNRIIRCHEIEETLEERIEDLTNIYSKDSKSNNFPYIIELNQYCEEYLNLAKRTIREINNLISLFFDIDILPNHNADKLIEKIGSHLPPNNRIEKLVQEDKVWIKYIADLRNSLEHEKPKLIINNIQPMPDNKILAPTWHLEGYKPCGILNDISTLNHNLLNYCEEYFAMLCLETSHFPFLDLIEISEEDRLSECPKRFKATINKTKLP